MSDTQIKDRARRFAEARVSKRRWPWHEHKGTSWEFQVLDVLRDIRGMLVFIAIIVWIKL